MACVNIPALPLQILLRRLPGWRSFPAAVVDEDKPQGRLLYVNDKAEACRLFPGMRYAAALSVTGQLRAAPVSSRDVDQAIAGIIALLHTLTPDVERGSPRFCLDPGNFWLNATGLVQNGVSAGQEGASGEALFASLGEWAGLIRTKLQKSARVEASVVVGFSKLGTYALAKTQAKTHPGARVLQSQEEEEQAIRDIPLIRLGLEPKVRDLLSKLGLRVLDDFIRLPAAGIEKRFGAGAASLYRQAAASLGRGGGGALQDPLRACPHESPLLRRARLDHGEESAERLLEWINKLLRPLVETLAAKDQAVAAVEVRFVFENGARHGESLRPAAPTRDEAQIDELIRLRLAAIELPDRVEEVLVQVVGSPPVRRQLELFSERPERDLAAANRALARVRAELGETAVVHAQLRDGHLPEAQYAWESLKKMHRPGVGLRGKEGEPRGALIRRIYERAWRLPPRPKEESPLGGGGGPDGWMLRGLEAGPVVRVSGPYIVSGGWWQRLIHREYHFAEMQTGEILWVFYDRLRRRWSVQGRVE